MSRRILVTSALPYANGALHIGHLLEYVQTDVWVRYQRLAGNDCRWVWADDAHGTPIMLKADAEGVSPEALIERYRGEHERDIAGFLLSPDNFHTTHSPENREVATMVYERLRDAGHIVRRTIEQLYDTEREMFLPDRFVKGTCPNCGTLDQYGDNCESCSATYDATELLDPISQVSGTTPVRRESEQLFFALGHFQPMLEEWTRSGTLQPEIANKMREWLDAGLQDWDISRNAPYFGFEIPDAPGKYFYVWLDAPIGYIASHKHLAERTGEDWMESWRPGSDVELYHFIGKDIANFHCLFWPAMLEGAGLRKPTGVFCHGFLTVDGAKMSKSRGTSITVETWLAHLEPEYLRYYFAAKLGGGVVDLNLNLEDFVTRVNADLVGKVVNIASRCAGFVTKRFDGRLAPSLPESLQADYETFVAAGSTILSWYEQREYGKAMREIMLLAEHANTFINDAEPWVKIKDPEAAGEVHEVCTLGLNQFRAIATYLSPVLPALAEKSAAFLNTSLTLEALDRPLLDHPIEPYRALMTRVDPERVTRILEATRGTAGADSPSGDDATVSGVAADAGVGGGAKGAGTTPADGNGGADGDRANADAARSEAVGGAGASHGAGKTGAASGGTAGAGPGVAAGTGAAAGGSASGADAAIEPIAPEITIDDMARIDLRVARIVDARHVDGADRLVELTLDIGLETRTVLAGIKAAYAPEDLVGRHTVMVANLAPRKMRFGTSNGMVLAAGPGGSELFVLSPDEGARPGMRVK